MKKLFAAFLLITLAACAQDAPPPVKALIFHSPGYRFNVSRIDVVDDFQPAAKKPRTEYTPDVSPANAMHKWVAEKLSYGGRDKILEVHLTEAQIVKKDIPKTKSGVEGLFTKEQTEEYNGKLFVELKIYSPERTLPIAHAEVQAERSHTLREDASLEDRKAMYRQLTAELMGDIENSLDDNIRRYFSNYLM